MSGIFLKILHMGYAAGWLMMAVILARLLLKKAPKRMICLLWALAALRLLCPVSVKSALSLIPDSETLTEMAVHEISFPAETGPQDIQPYAADNGNYAEIGANVMQDISKQDIPKQPKYDVMDVLAAVWAAGVVLMLVYGINGYYRIKRRTGASIPVRENIMKCDAVDTPFILGVLRPRIFLPSVMEDWEMEYVVSHEREHIKRRDHWWKPMGFLILCVYWFHPLCWISYILFCRDLELACDESVVKTMNMEDKKAYANALLSYSMNRSRIAAYPLAFGEVGVKERIRNVLNYKKPAFWMIAVSAAIGIVVAVCFLTDPERKNGEEQPGVSSQITESSKDEFAEDSFSEGYTDEELCRMAYDYCIAHSDREGAPVHVEVDHVLEDGMVLIHLYDIVYDMDGIGWTSSWDWYTVDRITGKGHDVYDKDIDLTEARIDVISRFMEIPWEEIEAIPNVGYNDSSELDHVICIGEIPEYDIRVYGYNDEEISGRGVAIDIAGDVSYFDWFYTSSQQILPKLYWDENTGRLQMALHTYTGTGFSTDELVILQQYDTGTLEPYYFGYDDYTKLLSERIDYRFDQYSRELTLVDTATGREAASVIIPEAETDFLPDGEITGIACGDISYFELGDTISFFVTPGFFREGYAIPEYESMPLLEFEVDCEWVTDAFGNAKLSFTLGELTGVDASEE